MQSYQTAEVIELHTNTKTCARCLKEKQRQHFSKCSSRHDGLYQWCKPCASAHKKTTRAKLMARERVNYPSRKTCVRCQAEKDASEFRKCRSEPSGLDPHCSECRSGEINKWRAANPDKVRFQGLRAYEPERQRRAAIRALAPPRFTDDGQLCCICGHRKLLGLFSRSATDPSGYVSTCKPCSGTKVAEWRQKNEDRARKAQRAYHRQVKYGLSREAFEALLSSQGGKCAVCQVKLEGKVRIHVDHDHDTGAVRGVLCGSCNVGLGQFKDDIRLLKLAVGYLEKTGSGQ